jgi:hypothetical protein
VVGNVNSSNFGGGGSNLSTEEIRYLEKQRQEHKLGILLVRKFIFGRIFLGILLVRKFIFLEGFFWEFFW